MPGSAETPTELVETLDTYVELIEGFAPGLVEGLYLVGSAALGDWHAGRSDVDIVAVTAEPATEDDDAAISAAHAALVERQPAPPVDGPYLAWADLIAEPATGLHRPWTLGGEFHHDGDCFEINPVTWYTLATYGITVRGPTPDHLEIALDVEARIRFVVENLTSYWRLIGEQLADAAGRRELTTADLEWCTLGPLRLHYTAFTADVTSKRGAGEHGLASTPAPYHDVIRDALEIRGSGIGGTITADQIRSAADLIGWILGDVEAAR